MWWVYWMMIGDILDHVIKWTCAISLIIHLLYNPLFDIVMLFLFTLCETSLFNSSELSHDFVLVCWKQYSRLSTEIMCKVPKYLCILAISTRRMYFDIQNPNDSVCVFYQCWLLLIECNCWCSEYLLSTYYEAQIYGSNILILTKEVSPSLLVECDIIWNFATKYIASSNSYKYEYSSMQHIITF